MIAENYPCRFVTELHGGRDCTKTIVLDLLCYQNALQPPSSPCTAWRAPSLLTTERQSEEALFSDYMNVTSKKCHIPVAKC